LSDFGRHRIYHKSNIPVLGPASSALDGGVGSFGLPRSYNSITSKSSSVARSLSSILRTRCLTLTCSSRNHHEMIQISTSLFMTATASRSTSQTQSRRTHYCFTQQHYHSFQQTRASIRSSIAITRQKLFVAWRRCGLNSYCSSKAMMARLLPSHSRLIQNCVGV